MTNQKNISNSPFTKLKNFEIAPPKECFELFKKVITNENYNIDKILSEALLNNSHYTSAPFDAEFILQKIKNTPTLSPLKKLKIFEVTPPFSFDDFLKLKANKTISITKNSKGKVLYTSFVKKIMAAAAVIVLLLMGYNLYNKKNKQDVAISTKNTHTTNPIKNKIYPTNDSVNNNTNTKQPIVIKTYKKIKQNTTLTPFYNYKISNTDKELAINNTEQITIGTDKLLFLDNDYLATFASFNESNTPTFLQADNPLPTTLSVNEYTSINVSAAMGGMMKKMYKTKKSGKPTRRARKTIEKLEKWKKVDAQHFDSTNINNPLDPFELSNFIFYK